MFEPNDTVILEGTKANGRFGHSIVNLGDINGDDVEGQSSNGYILCIGSVQTYTTVYS